jgi:hypothetical protein
MSSKKSKKQPKKNNPFLGTHNPNDLKLANNELVSGIIQWSFCIIGTIFLFTCLGLLITKIYHPETESIVQAALEKCIVTDFQPEPVEALLFRTGLIFIPCCILGLYFLTTLPFFKKIEQSKGLAYTLVFLAAAGIAFLGYYVFAQDNPTYLETLGRLHNERDRLAATNYDFFFKDTFLETHLAQYFLLWVSLLLLFYLFVVKFVRGIGSKVYKILSSAVLFVFAGIILIQIFNMMHFDMPLNWENQFDFNAVFYSATQVNAGSQLFVDNFTNIYGLYPHFLQPFFNLFGFSVSSFTLIMSLLIVFSFAAILLFLYTTVQDKILVFLGFASCLYFPYLLNRLVMNFDATFAIFPIRTTPVALLLLTVSLFLIAVKKDKQRFQRIVYYVGTVLMAFGVIWNFEFGLVSYLSWLAFLCYYDFFSPEKNFNWKKILFHFGVWIVTLLLAFACYGIIQRIHYGHFPDFSLLTSTLSVFGSMGFFMLPMPLFHPWMLLVLVHILCLVYAISRLFKKDITPKSAVIFLMAILGCGLFAYYQGRSHNWPFVTSLLPGLIELTLLTDELWAAFKRTNNFILTPLLYLCFAGLFLSTISLGAASSDISNLANQTVRKELKPAYTKEKKYINSVNHFIDSCDISSDRVILLCSNKYQGLFMQDKRMRSAVNPGILDLFYKSDAERYVTALADSAYDVFLGNNFYYTYLSDIRTVLVSEYQVVDRLYDTTALIFAHLQKRNVPAPSTVFFPKRNTTILHEKFVKDSTYYKRLCKLSQDGEDSLDIPSTFTVEILFRADSLQFYQYPVLCANNTDSSGFAIFNTGKKDNPEEYYINLGGIGFPIQLKSNQWHYLTVVFSGQQVYAYDNGQLKAAVMFPSAYQKSANKLYVGNNGSMRHFSGIINEVSISSGSMSAQEISNTWQKINSWIQKNPLP